MTQNTPKEELKPCERCDGKGWYYGETVEGDEYRCECSCGEEELKPMTKTVSFKDFMEPESEVEELRDRVSALSARIAKLEGLLDKYGKHDRLCKVGMTRPESLCDCGLNDALSSVLENKEGK